MRSLLHLILIQFRNSNIKKSLRLTDPDELYFDNQLAYDVIWFWLTYVKSI